MNNFPIRNEKRMWETLARCKVRKINRYLTKGRNFSYVYNTPETTTLTPHFFVFNHNINRAMVHYSAILECEEGSFQYQALCDSVIIASMSAFESYMNSLYIQQSGISDENLLRGINFQNNDTLIRIFGEFNIPLTPIERGDPHGELWRRIFASLENGGYMNVRHCIIHQGWERLYNIFRLLDLLYIEKCILDVSNYIFALESQILNEETDGNWFDMVP